MTPDENAAMEWLDVVMEKALFSGRFHAATLKRLLFRPVMPEEPSDEAIAEMCKAALAWEFRLDEPSPYDKMRIVYRALYAHLTQPPLPKVREVEVWHVAYAGPVENYSDLKADKWQPFVDIKYSKDAADAHAKDLARVAGCRFVAVTGPFKQEIPA